MATLTLIATRTVGRARSQSEAAADGFNFEAAHARVAAYKSRLSRLSPESRKALLSDTGPEVAGIPGYYDKLGQ
jgi:hypothetical protein